MTDEDEVLLTPRQVALIIAKAWGRIEPLPDKTLRDWRNERRGPYWIKQGAKPKYPRSKLNQWLQNGELSELEDLPYETKVHEQYAERITSRALGTHQASPSRKARKRRLPAEFGEPPPPFNPCPRL